jgi:hypothetical protein
VVEILDKKTALSVRRPGFFPNINTSLRVQGEQDLATLADPSTEENSSTQLCRVDYYTRVVQPDPRGVSRHVCGLHLYQF